MNIPLTPSTHIAILWLKAGPYHLARLKASVHAVQDAGGKLTAIEIFPDDPTYAWEPTDKDPAISPQALVTWDQRNSFRKMYKALDRVFKNSPPDVIAIPGWGSRAARTAAYWARRNNCATIVMSASSEADSRRNMFTESLKRFWVSRFHAGLVGGSPQADYLHTLGIPKERIFKGYNVVDNHYFATPAPRPALPDSIPENYFITAARFIPLKNLDGLLHAYADYRDRVGADRAWGLVLCGDGPERNSLQSLANSLNLERIAWPGFVQLDALPGYYQHASAFVLPTSVSETWGLVVNEAMAAGLPVIVSDRVGCKSDLVTPQSGRVFNPQVTSELSTLLSEFHQMPLEARQNMSTHAKQTIANWSPARFASGLIDATMAALEAKTMK